jgi:hypothetical protein
MKCEEAGCYLEINVATGNIERVAIDPRLLEPYLEGRGGSVKEACGGFCQHSLQKCLRIAD